MKLQKRSTNSLLSLFFFTVLLTSCQNSSNLNNAESPKFITDTEIAIPNPFENSNHGFLLEDNRIPKISSCAKWLDYWGPDGLAISFEVVDKNYLFGVEVSTQIYLKNQHLDSNKDGVICYLNETSNLDNPSTFITAFSDLLSIENCKIKQASRIQDVTRSGFPQHPDYMTSGNPISVQFLYIDFPDLIGKNSVSKDFENLTKKINDFLFAMSENSQEFIWQTNSSYLRMPKPIEDYQITREKQGNIQTFIQDVIDLADPSTNFSETDIVIAVPPSNVSTKQADYSPAIPLTSNAAFRSDEGTVYRATMAGADTRFSSEGYLLIAHEIGHLLGLQDYYWYGWESGMKYEDQFKYMGQFDNMNFAPGNSREWSAWSRWLLRYLDDSKVRCVNAESRSTHKLVSLSELSDESKLVVVPLSGSQAIAVESRRNSRYDKKSSNKSNGLLVYKVDTSKLSGFGPLAIVKKEASIDPLMADAVIQFGESVEIDGIRVSNIESGKNWDVAEITTTR